MKKVLVIGIILLFVWAGIVSGFDEKSTDSSQPTNYGNILCVGGNGPGNYTSIQSAIDAASDGDTILVAEGTYYEHVFVNKMLTILGRQFGTGSSIIDGSGSGSVVTITHNTVVIRNFTIQHCGSKTFDAGIYLYWYDGANIVDNIITLNNNGMFLSVTNYNTIDHNIFENNINSGIYCEGNSNTISNNTINNCGGYGINVKPNRSFNVITHNVVTSTNEGIRISGNQNTILNNTVGPSNWFGISLSSTNNNDIGWNTIIGNKWGIYSTYCTTNNITNNTIKNNVNFGIELIGGSSNTISYNFIIGNQFGLSTTGSNNLIYNNYFNNTKNAFDNYGTNIWNISIAMGTNILGGPLLGGNYWSDYPYWNQYTILGYAIYNPNGNGMVFESTKYYPIPTNTPGVFAQDNHPIPGFELVFVLCAIAIAIFLWRKKRSI